MRRRPRATACATPRLMPDGPIPTRRRGAPHDSLPRPQFPHDRPPRRVYSAPRRPREVWHTVSIGTQIDRYLARLIFVPLLGTLCLAAMLLLLDRMLRCSISWSARAGRSTIVWRMLANLIPEYLGLAIPARADARHAARLPQARSLLRARFAARGRARLRPAAARALSLRGRAARPSTSAIVGFVQPYAQYAYQSLRFELRSGALGASIKVGEFTNLGRRMTLAGRAQREWRHRSPRRLRPIAEQRDGRTLAVDRRSRHLPRHRRSRHDPLPPDQRPAGPQRARATATPRVLSFVQHDLPIDLPAIEAFRGRGDGTKELTLPSCSRIGAATRARRQPAQRGARQFPLPAGRGG